MKCCLSVKCCLSLKCEDQKICPKQKTQGNEIKHRKGKSYINIMFVSKYMKYYLVAITFISSEEIISLQCIKMNMEIRQDPGKEVTNQNFNHIK